MLLPRLWSCLSVLAVGLVGVVLAKDELDGNEPEIKSITLRTHSIESPYLDSDMQSRWFEYGGDTLIRTDQYIRLTTDRPSRAGWLWSRVPLTATNWEVTVEFKIQGNGNLYGDGMAMWVTKGRAQGGTVFGSADQWEGLGIFIDTYKNHRPGVVFPLVMASINDGTKKYDKDDDGKENELKGCSARGIRSATIPTKMRVTYFLDKSLKVELQYKVEDKWELCFEAEGVKIPPVAYLGFSAETGELSDNHDIISVQTKNLYQPAAADSSSSSGSGKATTQQGKGPAYNQSKKQAGGGSWTWFFFKFLLFGVAISGAYVGFTAYRSQRWGSRF